MNAQPDPAEEIREMRGSLAALDVVLMALVPELPDDANMRWLRRVDSAAEIARVAMLNSGIADAALDAFDQNVRRWELLLAGAVGPHASWPRLGQSATVKKPA